MLAPSAVIHLLPLRPLAGGDGRGEVGRAVVAEPPASHLTLPSRRDGPLPLPRTAAERGVPVRPILQ
jgi:hypothetical protein